MSLFQNVEFQNRISMHVISKKLHYTAHFKESEKFSTTYAIVLFFFLPTCHENLKFLQNCSYDFHKNSHSHSTPKGAPACAMTSKSYDWDVRNLAKISPKWPKNSDFSIFFSIFSKTVHTIRTKFSSHSTPSYGLMCAISINSYDWDWSESEGKRAEPTPLPHLRLWFPKILE